MGQVKQHLQAVIERIVWEINDAGLLLDVREAYRRSASDPVCWRLGESLVCEFAMKCQPDNDPVCWITTAQEWPELVAAELEHAKEM